MQQSDPLKSLKEAAKGMPKKTCDEIRMIAHAIAFIKDENPSSMVINVDGPSISVSVGF